MSNYNASSIRVLRPEEAAERCDWVKASDLAMRYKWVPESIVARLLEASRLSGEDWPTVERRYLRADKSVDVSQDFRTVYAELADQRGK